MAIILPLEFTSDILPMESQQLCAIALAKSYDLTLNIAKFIPIIVMELSQEV